ncbi:MAG: hypothetical protein ACP5KN_15055 [Armatimonadota bacterium]
MRRVTSLIANLVLVAVCAAGAWAVQTEKLNVVANLTEERVQNESEYDLSTSVEGVWAQQETGVRWEFTLNSDYDRSLTAEDEYDRLKMWLRYLIQQRAKTEWNPLIMVSTEGDHDFDKVNTLVAAGYRKYFDWGFVELTGGASKDIQTGDDWVGDVGGLVQVEKGFGRFTWTVNPEVSYGLLGEVRFRENRTIYSLSTGLSYDIGRGLGAAYRLRLNNSKGDDRRHQFLGVSYSYAR